MFCAFSDGIGRTGAFCTLYSVLERVKTEQIVDVFQAVKTLRIQRTGLMTTVVSCYGLALTYSVKLTLSMLSKIDTEHAQ